MGNNANNAHIANYETHSPGGYLPDLEPPVLNGPAYDHETTSGK